MGMARLVKTCVTCPIKNSLVFGIVYAITPAFRTTLEIAIAVTKLGTVIV